MEFRTIDFPIERASDEVDEDLFWYVIEIWWTKPHCVNKRICGADLLDRQSIGALSIGEIDFLKSAAKIDQWRIDDCEIRRLFPKEVERCEAAVNEILYRDNHNSSAIFLPRVGIPESGRLRTHVDVPYVVYLTKDSDGKAFLNLKVGTHSNDDNGGGTKWLSEILMPTLVRWMKHCTPEKPLTHPLRLVDIEAYNECYQRLKNNYGKRLVEIWPERTDPKKFVYEDIAIAAYLLVSALNFFFGLVSSQKLPAPSVAYCNRSGYSMPRRAHLAQTLWDEDRKSGRCNRMQTFVDLGCGNGLLVYLLTSEKHSGYGIDLRKRHIWDLYGPNVTLIERAFEPSDRHLFPDADWIIGNHSDELTPWIPVIALKSSSYCNFFVIPCCAWDFKGKYQRKDADLSKYRSYLRYVKNVGEKCGFVSEDDILKIPSTKRACVVGRRNGDVSAETAENNIRSMLGRSSGVEEKKQDEASSWIGGFLQREAKEPIRNCTTLPKTSIELIVAKITNGLLEEKRYVDIENGKLWNAGRSLAILECAQLLDEGDLQILKSQCGGLQTLLRNHGQIFNVQKGVVSIRDWIADAKRFRKNERLCWFHKTHPDGCPLSQPTCPYIHGVVGS